MPRDLGIIWFLGRKEGAAFFLVVQYGFGRIFALSELIGVSTMLMSCTVDPVLCNEIRDGRCSGANDVLGMECELLEWNIPAYLRFEFL